MNNALWWKRIWNANIGSGKNSFVFLRATFFRWAKQIEALCAELETAPRVLSVGDTHTENFGT